jgi:hypothetical protein
MRRLAIPFVLAMSPALHGQQVSLHTPSVDSAHLAAALAPRTIEAIQISGQAPVIDGALEDEAWNTAPLATDFVEGGPRPGVLPRYRTEFRVLYDAKAIYFGIRAYDPIPATIVAPFPRRDDETRSDWFFVEIDSRHDHRTGFGFGINPRGVQVDAAFDAFINYDYAWDAVWQGASRIDSLGWTAEYRIPFSQLSYSAAPGTTMEFGLNVYRSATRGGESSDWSPRLPTYADIESHFNTITGLIAPESPERLEIVPYSAARSSFTPTGGNPLVDHASATGYAGGDLRLRLAGGFTATAAIRPDFGQVEADPSQINLTTFETYFAEQRPFFVEGSSQFAFDLGLPFSTRGNSFSNEQPFYSRRIGGAPQGDLPISAGFSDVPTSTTLLGAAKLSGRSSSGWSAGAMTAVTDRSVARYLDGTDSLRRITVEPTTGFGALRLSHASPDGGSAIGMIGTVVIRPRMDSSLALERPDGAFALGLDGRHRFGHGDYEVSGFAVGSRVEGSGAAIGRITSGAGHFYQRPDAGYLRDDSTRNSLSGGAAQLRVAKLGGQWHWSAIGHLITPGFEINDLGFQRNADWLLAIGALEYQHYRPGHLIRRWAAGMDRVGAGWDFGGERKAALASGYLNASFRNYWSGSITAKHEWTSLATDVLRGGPGLLLPPVTTFGVTVNSDSRRPMQLTTSVTASSEAGSGSHSVDLSPTLTWRATDRLALTLGPEYSHSVAGWQYAGPVTLTSVMAPAYMVGRLDQTTASVTARADFAFSSRMTLQLYAQPFLSSGHFTGFQNVVAPRAAIPSARLHPLTGATSFDAVANDYRFDLDGDGRLDASIVNPDFNQEAFNLNLVWRWEYRPGSTIYLVWTQRRGMADADGTFGLGRGLGSLFRSPASNVVLLKVSYRIGL